MITGPELARLIGYRADQASIHAARWFDLPRVGSGNRRTFTVGQAVAAFAVADADLASTPHDHARRLILAQVPNLVDAGATWIAVYPDDDALLATHGDKPEVLLPDRSDASVAHLIDVGCARTRIAELIGRQL